MNRSLPAVALALLLASCGGGSGGGSSSRSLSGVAATGAGIQGTITLEDGLGQVRSTSTSNGHFTFDTDGLTPPFLLRAAWGGHELYSFATGTGIANITPLTEAIVRSAAAGADPATLFASPDPSALAALAARLPDATAKCLQSLDPLLQEYSAAIDPITGIFAPDHTGMDQLLDEVGADFSGGVLTLQSRLSGNLLFSAPFSDLSLGLSAQAWSTAEALAAEDPSVAVDPDGQGLVAWSQKDSGHYYIHCKWLSGPDAPAVLSTEGEAAEPKVAFDASGNALVVWAQYGVHDGIWSARYTRGAGWSAPMQIAAATGGSIVYYPDLGVDAAGNALAAWYAWDGVTNSNHFDVFAARFTAASGTWGAAAMRSDGTHSAYRCRIAVEPDGKGLLAWTQAYSNGSIGNDTDAVVAQVYTSAWSADRVVNSLPGYHDTGSGTRAIYGQVAVALDGSGNGTVLWSQADSSGPYFVWANQLTGSSWGTADTLSKTAIDNCYSPEVAYVGGGQAVAAWKQQDMVTAFTVASVCTGGTWSAATLVSDGIDECYDPHVAGDALGNASVIWFQVGASEVSIHANRYLQGLGWGTPQQVGITSLTPTQVATQFALPVSAVGANAAGQSCLAWGIDPL